MSRIYVVEERKKKSNANWHFESCYGVHDTPELAQADADDLERRFKSWEYRVTAYVPEKREPGKGKGKGKGKRRKG